MPPGHQAHVLSISDFQSTKLSKVKKALHLELVCSGNKGS
jgi:hypothetical protein